MSNEFDINDPDNIAGMAHIKALLKHIGDDPEREGLLETPKRVMKAYEEYFSGYKEDPSEHLKKTFEEVEGYDELVMVSDIEVFSHCEHHLAPFIGKAHVAYIPNGYVTGLSKIARVVEAYARRLQVQERLTTQIRDVIHETLKPLGVAVVIEAQHMCMQIRGIQKQNSVTTTSDFTGAFLKTATREEFIHLINAKLY